MKLGVAEILTGAAGIIDDDMRVTYLQQHDSVPLRTVLQCVYDPNIKFLLPEGSPPYKPNNLVDQEHIFYHEARKMYLFVEGGNPNLKPSKRESLFVQLLEAVDPNDAKMLIAVKDKHLPYPGVSEAIVRRAFPALLPESVVA